MRSQGFGFEFGVELAAYEPRMIRSFDYFYVDAVGGAAGDAESGARQSFFVFAIEFVAVAVAFGNFELAVGFGSEGAGLEFAGPGAEAHGAAHFVHAEEFAEFVDDAIGSGRIEFGAIGVFDLRNLARVFDRGALHAQADAEEWDFFLARVGDGVNHSGDAAFSEPA